MSKIEQVLLGKMFHEPNFRKAHDAFAEAYNNLVDKLTEKGIDLKYLDEAIKASSDYENYVFCFKSNWLLSELNVVKEANINE